MAQARNQNVTLSAVTATGTGTAVDVSGYQYVAVSIYCVSGTATVKFKGSTMAGVTLSSAVGVANQWDYVGYIDCQTVTATAGDTGVSLTDGDCRNLVLYTAGLHKVAAEVTARSGSTVTAYIVTYDNR